MAPVSGRHPGKITRKIKEIGARPSVSSELRPGPPPVQSSFPLHTND